MSAALAIGAAGANALSSVLQRRAARRSADRESLRPSLILHQLRRPDWLLGIGAMMAGFLLQAAALAIGGLLIVQPVLAFELPLTLLIGTLLLHSQMTLRLWLATLGLAAGLAVLLLSAAPTVGRPALPPLKWAIGIAASVLLVAVLVVAGRRSADARRAALLGIAAGCSFGLTAALMDAATRAFAAGLLAGLSVWQTYAMVAAGLGATYLLQSAFQAGRLAAAQPGVTISDPIVAGAWGLLLFGARARGGLFLIGEVAGGVLIVAGIVVLARSPALSGSAGRKEEETTDLRSRR
ncbi:MAG: DMT family transporter [Candidatus Dormibacteraceae bacterium]